MNTLTIIDKYKSLLKTIDKESSRLEQIHENDMACKKGCDMCCESLTIFPIEFHTIKKEIEYKPLSFLKKTWLNLTKSCRFLIEGECSIYDYRPIICRTQGLPILYNSLSTPDYELSACKLNFKHTDISSFTKENSLYMTPLNSQLFALNREFIKHNPSNKYNPTDRLKLNNI